MEFAGFIVAVIACVIVLYALPATIARRVAVVTSREGDRFSPGMELVPCKKVQVGEQMHRDLYASTRPLLPSVLVSHSEGTPMVNNPELGLPAAERSEGAKTVASVSRPEHPTRQMAALRARRVARLAREQAAVRRRVVMAGFASVLLLLFTVLAAVGVMSWLWLIVPAVLLVATVGSSVAGSFRAQSQSRDEVEELARIKDLVKTHKRAESRPTMRRAIPSSPKESPHGSRMEIETVEALAEPVIEIAEVEKDETEDTDDSRPPVEVASVRVEVDPPQRKAVEVVPNASSREWNVVSLPPVRGSGEEPVLTRRVHADTDLVPVQARRGEGVPARPLRKSDQVAAAAVAASQVTGPTFRFDLDAVLDQRRAQ